MCTPSNTCFIGPTRVHIPNGISFSSAHDRESLCYHGPPLFPLKFAPSHRVDPNPSNNGSLGATRVHNPISIGSAVFARLTTIVTDDRQATASVTIRRIYVVLGCGLKIAIHCPWASRTVTCKSLLLSSIHT